ncbi:MAG: hypothetical protein JXB26_13030 [Candidatus Aminicenantes bacterium]|nr:hypothetical protein [Candidatus Aminicenantes bacterium]
MNLASARKIFRFPCGNNGLPHLRKGAMTLTTVFLFFVFTTLGLGLLTCSRITLELSAAGKNSRILEYAAESGVKAGFQNLIGRLSPNFMTITETELSDLRDQTEKGETAAAERLAGAPFPLIQKGKCGRADWESQAHLALRQYEDQKQWFRTVVDVSLNGEGGIKNFRQKKSTILEARLDLFTGHVPTSLYPFLIDTGLSSKEQAEFYKKNSIKLHSLQPALPSPVPVFTQGDHLSPDASPLLSRVLKIDIFKPQDLTPARLRAVLGLPPSEEPVPEGVYLIRDGSGLGGIFVQGDLEELILAVDDGAQVIAFSSDAGRWMVRFHPVIQHTVFQTPEGFEEFDSSPRGVIVINGSVCSLSAGRLNLSGEIVPSPDEETPSVLSGLQLSIVCSDSITISSHLTHQGVTWKDGIPFVKNPRTRLSLFSAGCDFLDGSEKEGKITIGETGQDDIKIQAHLTSSGQGITAEGDKRDLYLAGSLQAKKLNLEGNNLELFYDRRLPGTFSDPGTTPLTAVPVIRLSGLRILAWKTS